MKNLFILASAIVAISVTYTADNASQEESHLRQSLVKVTPLFKYPGSDSTKGDSFDVTVNFNPNGDTWGTLAHNIKEKMENGCTLTALLVSNKHEYPAPIYSLNFYEDKHMHEPLSTIDWMLKNLKEGEQLELRARFDCDEPVGHYIKGD